MMLPGQTKEPPAQRYAIGVLGLFSCLILLYVSARMNYRFGFTLGKTPEDGEIYGMASAAADTVKALIPFVALWAWRNRVPSLCYTSAIVWLVVAAFALMGAAGHASLNRLDTSGQRTIQSNSYKDLRADRARAEKAIEWLPAHRGESAVLADLNGLKAQRQWSLTNECNEASIAGKMQREFCQGFQKLNSELGNAQQADKQQKRIDEINAKLGTVKSGAATSEADPQASVLSRLTGGWMNVDNVQVALTLVMVAALEVGGGLGPFAFIAYMFGVSFRHAQPQDIEWETIPPAAPPDAVKLEPAKPQLALPKPAEPIPLRAEPSPEWRALLDAIDYPKKKPGIREPLRAQDKREHVLGLRWLIWLGAHGRTGDFTGADVEALYGEFTKADAREAWGINVAKAELRTAGKKWITVRDSRSPTVWTIEQPKLAHVRDQLLKRQKALENSGCWRGLDLKEPAKADPTKQKGVAEESASPFVGSPASGPPSALSEPVHNTASAPKKAVTGMAQLSRHMPDLRAMGTLGRLQKAAWQQRFWSIDRKQINRMSRVRSA